MPLVASLLLSFGEGAAGLAAGTLVAFLIMVAIY